MAKTGMRDFFTAMWFTILVRGIASLAFGILAFAYPGITLDILVTVFGLYAVIDGLLALWAEYRRKGGGMTAMLQGLASLAAGVFCLALPAVAVIYVILLVGLWNIAAGLLQIAGAFVLRKHMSNALMLGLGGMLSAVLGLVIILYPAGSALSIIWIIAATAALVGLVLIAFAFSLRRVRLEISR